MSIVDFHNHLIPSVDDGAQTVEDARQGVAAFVADGVTAFVATPHFEGGLTQDQDLLRNRLGEIDEGWAELETLCRTQFPQVRIFRGVELLLDVPEPDLSDERLRLNGGQYFLVEFPFMAVPPHAAHALRALSSGPYRPVLAHPERYQGVVSTDAVAKWKEAGALLQVNGGSLLGRFGHRARGVAFELLHRGLVDYVCSDYHARGEPMAAAYYDVLVQSGGPELARTLMETNPGRLLQGEAPLPVAPLRSANRSVWQRVSRIFR
jgi:protein-tyrosine phosphatase